MKPNPGEYEKLEKDVNDFLQFITKFEFSISEFPETVNLSFEESLQFLEKTPEGQTVLSYFFTINDVEHWEYNAELSKKYKLFKDGVKKLKFWADYGIKIPAHFRQDKKFLEKAYSNISKLNLKEYTKTNLKINQCSPQYPQPHINIEDFKKDHLFQLSESIMVIKELIGPNSRIGIKGISIKSELRGKNNERIKKLFKFLEKEFNLKNQGHFVRAFTGKAMSKRFLWPKQHNTKLKLLLAGLIKENCLNGPRKQRIPWKDLTPTFCDENGKSDYPHLKGSGHIEYIDDEFTQAAIRILTNLPVQSTNSK